MIDYEKECMLFGFGGCECGGRIHLHHLINKGKLRGNTAAKIYCEEDFPEVFLCEVCAFHNVMRWADTKQARRILLKRKVETFGIDYVKGVVDGVPWKVANPAMSFKGIMSCPLPD